MSIGRSRMSALRIEDGEFVGIIGHTGSGKSTLIQIISSLIPQTAGRVLIDGVDYSQKDADKQKAAPDGGRGVPISRIPAV